MGEGPGVEGVDSAVSGSIMSKRKVEAAPSVVINNNTTIHNYFSKKEGPTRVGTQPPR